MTIPSVYCEARKVSYRQTKDGLVVSFVIHPNDMPDALAIAPLGTRYVLALAQIGDDEQPVSPAGIPSTRQERTTLSPFAPSVGRESTDGQTSPAGERSRIGKDRYATSSEMEKALIRASLLPKDERFQLWAEQQLYPGSVGFGLGEIAAADIIRDRCCNGETRKLIADDQECYRRFLAMETQFKIDTGQMAEPR